MPKFYHIDRKGTLEVDKRVELLKDYTQQPLIIVPDLIEKQKLVDRLNGLYPDGISYHGVQYLLNSCLITKDNFGKPTTYTFSNPMMEAIFELVRSSEFSHLPSRMQSMFCWQNLNDLKRFHDDSKHKIFEIETDNYFVGDMNLLLLGGQIIHAIEFARMYWSGERSKDPHLEVLVPLPIKVGLEVNS